MTKTKKTSKTKKISKTKKTSKLMNSAHTRPPRPLRPPNSFFLYREDKSIEVQTKFPHLTQKEINVKIGIMWKSEADEVKEKYGRESLKRFIQKRLEIPLYSYNPTKRSECKHKESPVPRGYSDSSDGQLCFVFENVVDSCPDDCDLNKYFDFDKFDRIEIR